MFHHWHCSKRPERQPDRQPQRQTERWIVLICFVFSLSASLAIGAVIVAWHAPRVNPGLQISQTALEPNTVWHFLAEGCDCSRRLADKLRIQSRSGAQTSDTWTQRIAWRNSDGSWVARNLEGRTLNTLIPATGIRSVPWLLVVGPKAELLYTGGYGGRQSDGQDILAAILRGQPPSSQPVRGCSFGADPNQSASNKGIQP